MQCPVCKDATLVMADRQGIEIDYCPKCRGVWLDRGELDKLIERATDVAPQGSQARQRSDERYYGPRKRKGFLGEMFDFD